MQLTSRILVALIALLLLSIAVRLLFDTSAAMTDIGLSVVTEQGRGTVRADVGGFFMVSGLLTLWGAASLNRNVLWPVQLMMVFALLGRVITVVVDGAAAAGVMQMGVEVVIIALLHWARASWPTSPTV
jgi:hypothetical protein